MVLEYEKGKSLRTWWLEHKDISEERLLGLLLPLLEGLGVVQPHRLPAPRYQNRTTSSCATWKAASCLLDFGAARSTAITEGDEVNIVTPGYGPVEQYWDTRRGRTPTSTLWAPRCTGCSRAKSRRKATARATNDTMEPAAVVGKGRFSAEFLGAIDWALKVKPEERPQDVQQFATALFAAHASALGPPRRWPRVKTRWRRRRPWLADAQVAASDAPSPQPFRRSAVSVRPPGRWASR